jgi:hypothetical protein
MNTFTGTEGVNTYAAIVLRSAIKLYAKTGMRANRSYTPTAMLAKAGEITGKTFKRGQFAEAQQALTEWLDAHGTAGK